MIFLPLVLSILDKSLDVWKLVLEGLPPDVRAEQARRFLAETEWLHKIAAKFSDRLEKLIDGDLTPPKPTLPIIPKGKV